MLSSKVIAGPFFIIHEANACNNFMFGRHIFCKLRFHFASHTVKVFTTKPLKFSATPQTNPTVTPGPQSTGGGTAGPSAVPANVNEAQLQKAYAALGLPYNGKQASTLQGNNPNRTAMNNQGRQALNVSCIVQFPLLYICSFVYPEQYCLLLVTASCKYGILLLQFCDIYICKHYCHIVNSLTVSLLY